MQGVATPSFWHPHFHFPPISHFPNCSNVLAFPTETQVCAISFNIHLRHFASWNFGPKAGKDLRQSWNAKKYWNLTSISCIELKWFYRHFPHQWLPLDTASQSHLSKLLIPLAVAPSLLVPLRKKLEISSAQSHKCPCAQRVKLCDTFILTSSFPFSFNFAFPSLQ